MQNAAFLLLRVLSDGAFHTGAELAQALDVPKTVLQSVLRELESLGPAIERRRGRGYRLAHRYECLDHASLLRSLGARAANFHIELLDRCDSTNTLLLERARDGAPSGSVIACELQNAGRGRRGNTWFSALGSSLTFSLLWRFAQRPAALSGLSLAAGVAAARALESLGIAGVKLKWPNDLVHTGCKLGGILIELHGEPVGPSAAVIGIGINLRLPVQLRDGIAQAVTDVAALSADVPSCNALLAKILLELERVLDAFARHGFGAIRDEWIARHAHQDREVTLALGDGHVVSGRATGVADDGALLLQTVQGEQRFSGGEISLRPS